MWKRWAVITALLLMPVTAFGQQVCDRRVNVSVALSATTEIVAAVAGSRVQVCGFVLGGNTATAFQFMSGGNAVSGVIFSASGTSIPFGGSDQIVIEGATSANLQLSVGTVPVTGVVLYRQSQN